MEPTGLMAVEFHISDLSTNPPQITAKIKIDVFQTGKNWCALTGPNAQEGCAGYGKTPSEALYALAAIFENAGK